MRRAIGAALVGLLGATALSGVCFGQAWSSPAPPSPTRDRPDWSLHSTPPLPSPPTRMWVHLNGAADLEHLRATNFNHYLRAQKILGPAAAKVLEDSSIRHNVATGFMFVPSGAVGRFLFL